METKFTPGPWPIETTRQLFALGDGRRTLADPEAEANAHLVAAAPDMYKALDELLALYSVSDFPGDWSEERQNCFSALSRARGDLPPPQSPDNSSLIPTGENS